MTASLELRDAAVVRGGRAVLHDCTVEIRRGAVTAILGPNGSGKSTLLRALSGLVTPQRGAVFCGGAPLRGLSRTEVARRVAFLPQETRCDFAFTVEELVMMGRHPHRGTPDEAGRGRRATEMAIDACGLAHLRRRTVDRLSGGERRRAAIARCLASDADVLLLDEPTAHLDLPHALDVFALTRSLADSGRAIAIASHDISAIARVATAAVVLNGGGVAAAGSLPDVLTADLCRTVFGVERHDALQPHGDPVIVFSRAAGAGAMRMESIA